MPIEILLVITIVAAFVVVLYLRKRGAMPNTDGTPLTLAESIRKKIEKQGNK
jgi:hypothetical protein